MKRRKEGVILARLMELTGAKEVLPTPEEQEQVRELEEFRERAARDAERQNAYLEKMKREKEIMDRARNMVDI
jgi:large subunit ribosomal protein MRP49